MNTNKISCESNITLPEGIKNSVFIGKDFLLCTEEIPDYNRLDTVVLDIRTKTVVRNLKDFLGSEYVRNTYFLNFGYKFHRDGDFKIGQDAVDKCSCYTQFVYLQQVKDRLAMVILSKNRTVDSSLYKLTVEDGKLVTNSSTKMPAAIEWDNWSGDELSYQSVTFDNKEFGIVQHGKPGSNKPDTIIIDYRTNEILHYVGSVVYPIEYPFDLCPCHAAGWCYIYHTRCVLIRLGLSVWIYNLETKQKQVLWQKSENDKYNIGYDPDIKRFVIKNTHHYVVLEDYLLTDPKKPDTVDVTVVNDYSGTLQKFVDSCDVKNTSFDDAVKQYRNIVQRAVEEEARLNNAKYFLYKRGDKDLLEIRLENPTQIYRTYLEFPLSAGDPLITSYEILFKIVYDAVVNRNEKTQMSLVLSDGNLCLTIRVDTTYRICELNLILQKSETDPVVQRETDQVAQLKEQVVRLKEQLAMTQDECNSLRRRVGELKEELASGW